MFSLRNGLHGMFILAASVVLASASEPETSTTNRFGFTGPEIFPIDNQIGQLHVADLDGDV